MSTNAARPVMVGSWNAIPAMERAAELYALGTPLLDAIVGGIAVVEDDPREMSVGYGGLPNEDGEVELDAAVMDGPLHKAGGVAGLKGVRYASRVALEVLRRTDHALLVGEGALKFARQLGFKVEDLGTPESRAAWLGWKLALSEKDGWIAPDEKRSTFDTARWAGQKDNPTPGKPPEIPFTQGTIHVSGLDAEGNLFSCTSTSGLSYKIPGRVGDTPMIGAGIYTDNSVGSAGATGRGESTLHNCAAFDVVAKMEAGLEPEAACRAVLGKIASRTREKRLKDEGGYPIFNVTLYALRKDGLVGGASLHDGYTYTRYVGGKAELLPSVHVRG